MKISSDGADCLQVKQEVQLSQKEEEEEEEEEVICIKEEPAEEQEVMATLLLDCQAQRGPPPQPEVTSSPCSLIYCCGGNTFQIQIYIHLHLHTVAVTPAVLEIILLWFLG